MSALSDDRVSFKARAGGRPRAEADMDDGQVGVFAYNELIRIFASQEGL